MKTVEYHVEGQASDGQWYPWDEIHGLKDCRAAQADWKELKATGVTMWRDSRIVKTTTITQVLKAGAQPRRTKTKSTRQPK